MELSKDRRGELALIALQEKTFYEGIKLSAGLKREILDNAKKLKVSKREACQMMIELIEHVSQRVIEDLRTVADSQEKQD